MIAYVYERDGGWVCHPTDAPDWCPHCKLCATDRHGRWLVCMNCGRVGEERDSGVFVWERPS